MPLWLIILLMFVIIASIGFFFDRRGKANGKKYGLKDHEINTYEHNTHYDRNGF